MQHLWSIIFHIPHSDARYISLVVESLLYIREGPSLNLVVPLLTFMIHDKIIFLPIAECDTNTILRPPNKLIKIIM